MNKKLKDTIVREFRERFGYINFVGVAKERFEHQEAFLLEKVEEAYEMGRKNGIKEGVELQKHMV